MQALRRARLTLFLHYSLVCESQNNLAALLMTGSSRSSGVLDVQVFRGRMQMCGGQTPASIISLIGSFSLRNHIQGGR